VYEIQRGGAKPKWVDLEEAAAAAAVGVGRGREGGTEPLSARILVLGFMSAESAVMGRRSGCMGMAMSTMTTLFCGEVSRTQMYFSDSMVTWVKVTNCGAMPRLVSCRAKALSAADQ
jgi:hypothetical protein